MADLAQQIKQRDQISANQGGKEEFVVTRGLVSIHTKPFRRNPNLATSTST